MGSVRLLLLLVALVVERCVVVAADDPCYRRGGVAHRCDPPLVNAAAGRTAQCTPRQHCGGIGALTDLRADATCWNWTSSEGAAAVNLTLGLGGGRLEVRYVGVRLCAPADDSLSVALYKSVDRGRSFTPFHFHSTRCEGAFGRRQDASLDDHGARCAAPDAGVRVLAFSALEGRPSAPRFDSSPLLQDWVTVTDVRISLVRHAPGGGPVGVADVSVGGRCKCNGHASECGEGGACLCRHNTAGRECERCRPFHFDRPWGRATEADAKECVECRCHGHSRACRFNVELYRVSGFESGGVCLRCRHRTAGRHCDACRRGYYRDPSRPPEHRKACKACDCHPVGSSGDACLPPMGQCPCKEGVTGLTCDRCAKGYSQSSSTLTPCVRSLNKNKPRKKTSDEGVGACGRCPSTGKKLSFRRYCSSDYAIQADVTSREGVGDWVRHSVHVRHVFKAGPARLMRTGGPQSLWVARAPSSCPTCPRLRPNRSYLVMGRNQEGGRYPGLHATPDSTTVLEWREGRWPTRMRRLQERQRRGECRASTTTRHAR